MGHGNRDGFESVLFSRVNRFGFLGDGGSLDTRRISVRGSPLSIARVTSSGHRITLTEEDALTFLVPRVGRVQVRTGTRDWHSAKGSVLALRPGKRETTVLRAEESEYLAYVLFLPVAELAASGSDRVSEAQLFGTGAAVVMSGVGALRLQEYLAFAVEDLLVQPASTITDRTARGFAALAMDMLFDLIEATVEAQGGMAALVTADAGLRRAVQAREILVERADEPLAIADLAQELGIGLRSLQLAFFRSFGTTPRAMLTQIRLENARAQLLAAGPEAQVTTIAMDAGFTHLSRFSQAYRRAFGERPVDTLNRSRRH